MPTDRRRCGDRRSAGAIAGRRLGGPHARQCLARARTQRRALHAVSHPGRPDRAAGRRRRRRQRGASAISTAGATSIATLKSLGATGGARVRDLSDRRSCCSPRSARYRACRRRRPAVRRSPGASAACCRCRSRRRCIRASSRWRCSMASSPRSPSRSGRSAARMTCRSRRCSATRSRRSGAGRAGAMSSRPRWSVAALAALAVALAYDRRIAAIFVAAAAGRVRAAAPGGGAAHADCARRAAAPALARRCGSPSPISTGRARSRRASCSRSASASRCW